MIRSPVLVKLLAANRCGQLLTLPGYLQQGKRSKHVPQRLKPHFVVALYGTAKSRALKHDIALRATGYTTDRAQLHSSVARSATISHRKCECLAPGSPASFAGWGG